MKRVAVYQAKTRLSELLTEVEQGGDVVITRRGMAVARLVAAEPGVQGAADERAAQVAGAFAALREIRDGVALGIPAREAIEQGRD